MGKLQEVFRKNVLLHLGDRPKLWLANESGINSGSLSTSIAEDGNATLKTVEALSKALKVSPSSLLGGSDGKTYDIPKDILESLEDQSPAVYETIRMIISTIASEKAKPKRSSKSS